MTGRIFLYDQWGDIVKTSIIKCDTDIQRHLDKWKRLYGKGFNRTTYKVEYDLVELKMKKKKEENIVYKKEKSKFKKGKVYKKYSSRRSGRVRFFGMDGYIAS